MSLRSFSNMMI